MRVCVCDAKEALQLAEEHTCVSECLCGDGVMMCSVSDGGGVWRQRHGVESSRRGTEAKAVGEDRAPGARERGDSAQEGRRGTHAENAQRARGTTTGPPAYIYSINILLMFIRNLFLSVVHIVLSSEIVFGFAALYCTSF